MAILTTVFALASLWWAVSSFVALRQTGEQLLTLQIGQGLAFALLFGYLSFQLYSGRPLSALISGVLLLMALAAGFIWRTRGGAVSLIKRYPRGMLDVVLLRRPAVDLKRRIRSK